VKSTKVKYNVRSWAYPYTTDTPVKRKTSDRRGRKGGSMQSAWGRVHQRWDLMKRDFI
jgi:hypothetical protein